MKTQKKYFFSQPIITIAVPSFNQGRYLERCLSSIFEQDIPIEVFVGDGGSTDETLSILKKWEHRLAGWYSRKDNGQSAAINTCIAMGTAPYVGWINSDDWLLKNGLNELLYILHNSPKSIPAVYGRAWNFKETNRTQKSVWVEPFNVHRLAMRCIISQPATLIRRSAWESVGGLNTHLHMAMDYDLWWRLFKTHGELQFVDKFIAVARDHSKTKTNTKRYLHYREAMNIVSKHYGSVPLKWWLFQPYAVWFRTVFSIAMKKFYAHTPFL